MATTAVESVEIPAGGVTLRGMLAVPDGAPGVVLFAHGSGSGRHSPRNQFVAGELRKRNLGTLLMDLLHEREADDRLKVFDITLLAERLEAATRWVEGDYRTRGLKIGYFGASTGAGAALQAAAKLGHTISAVVSRGGRPDLASAYLPDVTAPTLLIVGADDEPVIGMNRAAYELLDVEKQIVVVPGASHLFEEPGRLEEVSRLAGGWFEQFIVRAKTD